MSTEAPPSISGDSMLVQGVMNKQPLSAWSQNNQDDLQHSSVAFSSPTGTIPRVSDPDSDDFPTDSSEIARTSSESPPQTVRSSSRLRTQIEEAGIDSASEDEVSDVDDEQTYSSHASQGTFTSRASQRVRQGLLSATQVAGRSVVSINAATRRLLSRLPLSRSEHSKLDILLGPDPSDDPGTIPIPEDPSPAPRVDDSPERSPVLEPRYPAPIPATRPMVPAATLGTPTVARLPASPIAPYGLKGDKGDPGHPGKQGNPGKTGDHGLPGRDGRDGVDGKDGLPGDPGRQGDRGPPGFNGLNGRTGNTGPEGPRGPQGPQGPQGPPGPPGSSSSYTGPTQPGIDWRQHTISPTDVDAAVDPTTRTIQPWLFHRTEVGSDINHGIPFPCFVISKRAYIDGLVTPRLGTDGYTLKNFLYSFPKLQRNATKSEIFGFLARISRYCLGTAVYAPPPHTMHATDHRGRWYPDLPPHCTLQWAYYDNALFQALTMSSTGLADTPSVAFAVYESGGYQILWKLAYAAGHPRLNPMILYPEMPKQSSSMSLIAYRQEWEHYLQMRSISGTFLSDRFFLESFIANMSGTYNSSLKPLIFHLLRRIPIDNAVTPDFWPENLLGYMGNVARIQGITDLDPLQTPREFAERRRPSPRVTPAIRSLGEEADSALVEECFSLVCALTASNPRTCDLCGKDDHLCMQCPRYAALMRDPYAAKRLLTSLSNLRNRQDPDSTATTAQSSGATTPSARRYQDRSGNRTPPSSNRSRGSFPIRGLEGEDTDEDVSISRLTDDEASLPDSPDFP